MTFKISILIIIVFLTNIYAEREYINFPTKIEEYFIANKFDKNPKFKLFSEIDVNYIHQIEINDERCLYVYLLIKGNKKTFEYLKKKKEIPIRFQFFRYIGLSPVPEGSLEPKLLLFGNNDSLKKNYWNEFLKNIYPSSQKEFIEFEIYCKKEKVMPGRWLVKVVLLDNRPLNCNFNQNIIQGNMNQECQLKININPKLYKSKK